MIVPESYIPEYLVITKENPAYLYRIVLTANKSFGNGSYKEFAVVKAWSSSCCDILQNGSRTFDFYYNNRIYRHLVVSIEEGVPKTTSTTFSVWFKERNDEQALKLCKEWLNNKLNEKKQELNKQAWKLINDRQFASSLEVHNVEEL